MPSLSVLVNVGAIGTRAVDGMGRHRAPPGAQAEAPMLGQPRPQQDDENPTVRRRQASHEVTDCRPAKADSSAADCSLPIPRYRESAAPHSQTACRSRRFCA
jgi:hypothetical protein